MFPENWKCVELGHVADLITGFAFPSKSFVAPSGSTVRLLRGDNVMQGYLRWDNAKHYSDESKALAKYELRQGDVVIALDRPVTNAGLKCSVVAPQDLPCLLVQRVARLRGLESLHQSYLAQVTQTDSFKAHLLGNKTETAVPHVSPNVLRTFKFVVPSDVSEQERIAEVLGVWDFAIFASEKLLASSRTNERLLTQQLVLGKIRLGGVNVSNEVVSTRFGKFPVDWEHLRIERVATEISVKNVHCESLPVLSCTKYAGLVASLDYFKKRVFSQDTSTYKVVEKGCFAYATNHIDEGSIGYQDVLERGLISPMYTVFKANNAIDDRYLYKLLKTEHYRQIFAAAINASVDRRGSLRWSDFKRIEIPVPPLAEQARIVEVVSALKKETEILERQTKKLKQEKASLMRDLLTGKRRVRLPAPSSPLTVA